MDEMRENWGDKSLKYLNIWASDYGFPPSGSFSLKKLGLLEMRLREEERRAKTKLKVKKMIEISKQRACLKIWRVEAEQRARAMQVRSNSHTEEELGRLKSQKQRAPLSPPISSPYLQLAALKPDADLNVCPPARPPVPSKRGSVQQRQRQHAPQPGGLYVSCPGAAEDSQQPPSSSLPIAGTTCGHIQDQFYGKHVVTEAGPEGPPGLRRSRTPSDRGSEGVLSSSASGLRFAEELTDNGLYRLAIAALADAITDAVPVRLDTTKVAADKQKTDETPGGALTEVFPTHSDLQQPQDRGDALGVWVSDRDGRGRGRGDHLDTWSPDRQQGRWAHKLDWGRSGVDREGGGPDDELAQCVRAREGSAQHTHSFIANEHTDTHCCKEDALAGASDCSDFHTQPIQYLEIFHEPVSPSLHDGSQKVPASTNIVTGQPVVSSAPPPATSSVVKASEFSGPTKTSQIDVFSVDSPGQNLTEAVRCEDGLQVSNHQFLLSNSNPVDVIGMYPISKLEPCQISTPESVEVHKYSDLESNLKLSDGHDLLYVYQWKLQHGKLSSDLLTEAASLVSPDNADFMTPEDLHCTSHVSPGPDKSYEKSWSSKKPEKLTLTHLYWDEHRCAAAVSLNTRQSALYLIGGSAPHVSLSKFQNEKWKDLGPFVKRCEEASDWQESSDGRTSFSSSLQCKRKSLLLVVHTQLTVELVNESPAFIGIFLSAEQAADIPALREVPETLWATSEYDVGLIKGCEPIVITQKQYYFPRTSQHLLKDKRYKDIAPFFESLREAGVIIPCENPRVFSPLRPVRKTSQPTEWRFVLDLRAVNAAVEHRPSNVPNSDAVVFQVPLSATFFSVVDLANASFSVPVHPDSQFWFTFYFGGRCYTFTRLCQGYCETSTIYNEALRRSLEPLALTKGTALLQYIDDLMVCSPNREQCETDTVQLLKHLAAEGHKACLSKLQFVQEKVTYLGYIITAEGRTLSSKRVEAIQNCPKPHIIIEMKSFLGKCSSCRTFIPNYAVLHTPLNALLHGKAVKSHDMVTWTPEAEEAFEALKLALQTPATLRLPDPSRPFTQVADETDGCMTSVLLQEHQGKMTPVAYFSAKLDAFAAGFPRCLRAAVVAEKAAMASRETVGHSHLTLLAPHDVSMILQEQRRFHIPADFRQRYKTDFVDLPSVTVKRCTALNPATLLPSPGNVEEHDCADVLQRVFPPRPNLKKTPLNNADLVLFIDGSASRDHVTGQNNVGFAVVSTQKPLAWASLPSDCSAPAAALVALTEACKLAEGKNVTIYTRSWYAFGVAHDFDALWENRKFLKWDFEPFFHHDKVAALLDAILLPKSVAVCLFRAHANDAKRILAGNERARAAAADAAREPPPEAPAARFISGPASLTALQSFATGEERELWRTCGARDDGEVWRGPDDKPCLPKHFFPHFAKLTHGPDHRGKEGMLHHLAQDWFLKGFLRHAKKFCQSCVTCVARDKVQRVSVSQAAQRAAEKPFDHLMVNFITLAPSKGKSHCLVMVDMWSKWVEAFPTEQESSQAVANALQAEIIPRWGIPTKISSDKGAPFVNEAIQLVGEFLGISVGQHCAYQPAGASERETSSLKTKLDKYCQGTDLPWPEALPFVLMRVRLRKRALINLSPFEILFGRPSNPGVGPVARPLPCTALCEHDMLEYCRNWSPGPSQSSLQVQAAFPPACLPLHDIQPGHWILVHEAWTEGWKQGRWVGPYQVLLTTRTAVKVAGIEAWIHTSHCQQVPEPEHQLIMRGQ